MRKVEGILDTFAKPMLHLDIQGVYIHVFHMIQMNSYHLIACTCVDRYIELVKKHGLEISQPALAPDRGLTWQMTKRRGDVEVHKYVFILYLVIVL